MPKPVITSLFSVLRNVSKLLSTHCFRLLHSWTRIRVMSCPLTKPQTKQNAGRNFRKRGRKSTFQDKNHSFTRDPVPTSKTIAKYIVWFGTWKNYFALVFMCLMPYPMFCSPCGCSWMRALAFLSRAWSCTLDAYALLECLSIKRTETGELRFATNLCGLSGYSI